MFTDLHKTIATKVKENDTLTELWLLNDNTDKLNTDDEAKINDLEEEIAGLSKQLSEYRECNEKLNTKCSLLNDENSKLKNQPIGPRTKKLEAKNKTLTVQNKTLKQEIKTLVEQEKRDKNHNELLFEQQLSLTEELAISNSKIQCG